MLTSLNDLQARLDAAIAQCTTWATTVDALVQIVSDRPIDEIMAASPRKEG